MRGFDSDKLLEFGIQPKRVRGRDKQARKRRGQPEARAGPGCARQHHAVEPAQSTDNNHLGGRELRLPPLFLTVAGPTGPENSFWVVRPS